MSKPTVLVLGATGMLGSAVVRQLKNNDNIDLIVACREQSVSIAQQAAADQYPIVDFDASLDAQGMHTVKSGIEFCNEMPLEEKVGGYIVNCIGTIKPHVAKDVAEAIYINSVFPHQLVKLAKASGSKLIHITTDCVYDGKLGNYNENDRFSATDVYGHSKWLGEPEDCLVLRTSIIGPELHNNSSLIAWVLSQADTQGSLVAQINGYTDHYWNGVTTDTLGQVIRDIIVKDLWVAGKRHIYSPNILNKAQLVTQIAEAFGVQHKLNIIPGPSGGVVDRSLSTTFHEFLSQFGIPTIREQLAAYEK